jgi:predicted nucleotidyltransferase
VDIDYSVPTGWDYFCWYQELQDRLKKNVDVVSYKFINHRLRPYIEKDMTLVYEK